MNFGEIKLNDVANGVGVRVSLFVSGCRNQCPGCFNQDTWDFAYGKPFTLVELDEIITALAPDHISGLSVLGGEPLDSKNQKDVGMVISQVRDTYLNKDIWLYTGYTFNENIPKTQYTDGIFRNIDVLVDGRFIESLKDPSLCYRGSSNQRVINMKKTRETGVISIYSEAQLKAGLLK